jgi:phosphoglycerate dehydrogenase-like enzyme
MADAMGMRVIGFDPYAKKCPPTWQGWTWKRHLARIRCHLAALPADRRQPRLLNAQTLARASAA